LIAHYDKNDGFQWFSKFLTKITVSENAKEVLEKTKNWDISVLETEDQFNNLYKAVGATDDSLKSFLTTKKEAYKTKDLETYIKYQKDMNNGFKQLTASAKTMAKNLAIDFAIIGAVRAVSDIIGLIGKAFEETKDVFEEFDELSSELSSVESELSGLNSELSSVESQIEAIQSKGELSFADKEELSRLEGISSELEHQIKLTETLQESLKKSVSITGLDAYNTYANSTSFYSTQIKQERKKEAESIGSTIGNIAGMIIGLVVAKNPMVGAGVGSALGDLLGGAGGSVYGSISYDSEASVGEIIDKMSLERTKLTNALDEAYEAYTDDRSDGNKKKWEEASQALNDYNTALSEYFISCFFALKKSADVFKGNFTNIFQRFVCKKSLMGGNYNIGH